MYNADVWKDVVKMIVTIKKPISGTMKSYLD